MSFKSPATNDISADKNTGNMLVRQATRMVKSSMMKPVLFRTSALTKKGNMFAKQTELPHLPVPPLQRSLAKYLLAVQPLVDDVEFKNTTRVTEEFGKPGGIGERLQQALIERSRTEVNWIAKWWDNGAYFDFRMPVVVHSSPGIAFPKQSFTNELDQLRLAAKIIACVMDYKHLIDSEAVPVDMLGPDPMCMIQYTYLLSSCRIPHPRRDYRVHAKKGEDQHIIIIHNNRFYSLDVYHNGKPIPEPELVTQLQNVINASQNKDIPVGILTSDGRTQWAHARNRLLKDPGNKANLERIEKSLFVLCFDDSPNMQNSNPCSNADHDYTITSNEALHGCGSKGNSGNRWFDKITQFIINKDGYLSMLYEHSAAEGPPPLALCSYVMSKIGNYKETNPSSVTVSTNPKQLEWKLNAENMKDIETSKENIDSLVNDLDLKSYIYKAYGKNMAKKHKMSPDAFVQIIFHLSYYKLHRRIPPTYESASVRKFQLGRTDTIRTASLSSKAFVEAMVTPGKTNNELVTLFKTAVHAHSKYTKEACNGEAFDRHLFGLKKIAVESGINLPAFFMDKTFGRALHFNMSTSQIGSKFPLTASFGPVVPDGYGICYNPMNDRIHFNVATFNSNDETETNKMAETIINTFDEVGMMLSTANL